MAKARPPVAKKKSVSAKKKTAAKKKSPTVAKTRQAQQKKTTSAKKATATAKKKPVAAKKPQTLTAKKTAALEKTVSVDLKKLAMFGIHESNINLLPPNVMNDLQNQIQNLFNQFQEAAENNLTAKQRQRKIGPGNRNYGFLDKASDIAEANPQYAQFFDIEDLKKCIRNVEVCRNLALLLQSFARAVTNTMLIYSDDAYSMALDYYHTVQRQAKRGDPVAMELERTLRTFFHKTRRISAEPTITQTERDAHAILTHKKEGKIVIEGRGPIIKGGVTKVVDDTRKSKGSFKETEEGTFDN